MLDTFTPFTRDDFGWPASVLLLPATLPAVPPSIRVVAQLSIGALINPKRTIVAFYNTNATLLQAQNLDPQNLLPVSGAQQTDVWGYPLASTEHLNRRFSLHAFQVSEDYRRALRPPAVNGGGTERYGASPGTQINAMLSSYQDATNQAINTLVGWYSSGSGVFGIDKKVQLESMWLSTAGDVTTLNVALYNNDPSVASSAKSVQIAVFN